MILDERLERSKPGRRSNRTGTGTGTGTGTHWHAERPRGREICDCDIETVAIATVVALAGERQNRTKNPGLFPRQKQPAEMEARRGGAGGVRWETALWLARQCRGILRGPPRRKSGIMHFTPGPVFLGAGFVLSGQKRFLDNLVERLFQHALWGVNACEYGATVLVFRALPFQRRVQRFVQVRRQTVEVHCAGENLCGKFKSTKREIGRERRPRYRIYPIR